MASRFYRNVLPDLPGLKAGHSEVNVVEQDGKIGLSITHLHGEGWTQTQVFMTPEQGHELLRGLLEAIDYAETQRFRRRLN